MNKYFQWVVFWGSVGGLFLFLMTTMIILSQNLDLDSRTKGILFFSALGAPFFLVLGIAIYNSRRRHLTRRCCEGSGKMNEAELK